MESHDMLPSETPVGTVETASVSAGASKTITFASAVDRIRIATATGGRIRVRGDGVTPSTTTTDDVVQAGVLSLLVDGEEKVLDLTQETTEIRLTFIDAATQVTVSGSRRSYVTRVNGASIAEHRHGSLPA